MNKKITIFLSALFVLSFTFHYIFYNYVEDVKYSIASSEILEKELEFDNIKIISKNQIEKTTEEYPETYTYLISIKRVQENTLFDYNKRATIDELPRTIEDFNHCASGEICLAVTTVTKVIPYVSSTIFKNVIGVLILLIIHLINVRFNILDIEKLLLGNEMKNTRTHFSNFKKFLLKFLKSIIFTPFIALILVIMEYDGLPDLVDRVFYYGWGSMIILLLLLPIISNLNFYYVYKNNMNGNIGNYAFFFYHMVFSIIIILLLFDFYDVLLEFLDNQHFSNYINHGYVEMELGEPHLDINNEDW